MSWSSIEWTDRTWNVVTGCTKVSPGCLNCYAERIFNRWGRDFSQITLRPDLLRKPLGWRTPSMVFVCSMSDLFHRRVPTEFIRQVFATMEAADQHVFQVLTKRPGRMAHFAATELEGIWPSNVWAGTSVESAKYLPRLDLLAKVPARARFVSVEPLLGPLDMRKWLWRQDHRVVFPVSAFGEARVYDEVKPVLSWVIVGGESDRAAPRPLDVAWVYDIVAQCRAVGVPAFVKQLGTAYGREHGALDFKAATMNTWPEDLRVREWPAARQLPGLKEALKKALDF